MSDLKNLILAALFSFVIIIGWEYFVIRPKIGGIQNPQPAAKHEVIKKEPEAIFLKSRNEGLQGNRINILNSKIKGSISLAGARFDDVTLTSYKKNVESENEFTNLLSPSKSQESYFAEFGWVSDDDSIDLPNSKTIWQTDNLSLTPTKPVNLSWMNKQNLKFKMHISIDENYLFKIRKSIENNSRETISLKNYGLINKLHDSKDKSSNVHEGAVAVFDSLLKEKSYSDMQSKIKFQFNNNARGSWFGLTEKYWFVSIIPDQEKTYEAKFQHSTYLNHSKYQLDYLSESYGIKPQGTVENTEFLFAGAKEINLLEDYQKQLNLKLFDRAIDFGWFYFLTKPLLNAVKYFYGIFGNFGISILVITILIKLILFPLSKGSHVSMEKMKKLQPKIEEIKASYKDDKMKQNQAIMDLYKKEKVSPLAGCLPLLLQIPIFFSLYKVLSVAIEMRHAPFFGWIKDLSAPDPTTIFNLFGLIHWTPPSFLMIGAWPIIMAVSMYIQQQMTPGPTDPAQKQAMQILPVVFVFLFASFPAGLVIYWAWSNVLAISQQLIMNKTNAHI